MKIGVIGTINRDSIRLADGTRKEAWGGILYNLITLSYLLGDKAGIFPVCNVGADHYIEIMAILKSLPGVRTEYIKKVPENNNHCFLTYLDKENKHEILKGGVRPLVFDDIKALTGCNYILVNYISGRDLHLSSLKKLRNIYQGKIYIDIHSYTLGRKKGGARFIRRPQLWPTVVDCADYVQMNRLELAVLARNIRSEKNIGDFLDDDLKTIIVQLKRNGISVESKVIIITDSGRGCYLVDDCRKMQYKRHLGVEDGNTHNGVDQKNATGCGDCFAAGFVAGLTRHLSLFNCSIAGNAAGQNRVIDHRKTYSILDKTIQ